MSKMTGAEFLASYDGTMQSGWTKDDWDVRQRFILVECNRHGGQYWLTSHDTMEDAAKYHDEQEYPEDFAIEDLYDTQTGLHHYAVPHTTFEANPDQEETEA